MRASFLVIVSACGGGSGGAIDGPDNGILLVGECQPASGGTAIPTTAIQLNDPTCTQDTSGFDLVESTADWNTLFATCGQPVPSSLDLASQRAAVVRSQCTALELQFATETTAEVVVGVLQRLGGGACIGSVLVVPLPRAAKPVRAAQCHEECPSCPPAP